MKESTPSATALTVALFRALHSRTAPQPLINDTWGDLLVPESVVAAIRQSLSTQATSDSGPASSGESQADVDTLLLKSAAYANVILRCRYTEDALAEAVARGVRQYVLIGAGFDSYALRVPATAKHLSIFEIDHPATQDMKTARLAECGITIDDSVHFLPADLSRESLSAVLMNSAFSATEPAFFSLLGVTMYLSPADNRATMREIVKCGAPGSELVFSYVDQQVFSAEAAAAPAAFVDMQKQVAAVGEPFVSGFDPATLKENLRSVGLELREDLDDIQLIERYDSDGVNGLQSAALSRIARAEIVKLVA